MFAPNSIRAAYAAMFSSYHVSNNLGDVLGGGSPRSAGLVRRGTVIATGERVAIKLLKNGASTKAKLSRATEEIAMLKGLTHPNVYRVIDFFLTGDTQSDINVVFELVEGRSLSEEADVRSRDRVDKLSVLTPSELTSLLVTMVDVLTYLESKQIVHRDIQPGNIMMTTPASLSVYACSFESGSSSIFKLIDFGSALALDRPDTDVLDSYTNTLSTSGPDARIAYTEPYLSPEMLRFAAVGRSFRPQSTSASADVAVSDSDSDSFSDLDTADRLTCKLDVWSLGATLLQLATGVKILDRLDIRSFGDTKRKLKRGTWDLRTDFLDTRLTPVQRDLWLALSSELQDTISICLTASVEARPTARELRNKAGFQKLATEAEIVRLKAENDALRERVDAAQIAFELENDQLKAENSLLKAENDKLKTEVAKVPGLGSSVGHHRAEVFRLQRSQHSVPTSSQYTQLTRLAQRPATGTTLPAGASYPFFAAPPPERHFSGHYPHRDRDPVRNTEERQIPTMAQSWLGNPEASQIWTPTMATANETNFRFPLPAPAGPVTVSKTRQMIPH